MLLLHFSLECYTLILVSLSIYNYNEKNHNPLMETNIPQRIFLHMFLYYDTTRQFVPTEKWW